MSGSAELWKTHQQAQFPSSCLALTVDGVKLVKIDAVAGAILTASLRTDGVLRRVDDAKRRELGRQIQLIAKVLRDVPLDAEGKAYFERLGSLADLVYFTTG